MIRTSLIAQGKRQGLMSVLLAVLLLLLYFHLARFYRDRVDGWILAIGWALVILNVLRAGLGFAYRLDRHPFRRLDLELEDDRAQPGGDLRIHIELESRRRTVLERLTAELHGVRERGAGSARRESTLVLEKRRVADDLALAPGDQHRFEVALPVPAGAPFSFRDSHERIRWSLRLEAAVKDWGLLSDTFDVTVGPPDIEAHGPTE